MRSSTSASARRSRRSPSGWRPYRASRCTTREGGTVIPGLHDHHVHLRSSAAAAGVRARRAAAGPHRGRLRDALAAAVADADGWIRAVGYHDSVAGAAGPSRAGRPVAAGAGPRAAPQWRAVDAELAGAGAHRQRPITPTAGSSGRIRRFRVARAPSLRHLSDRLAAFGVTGITEATPGYGQRDIETLTEATQSGGLRQHLHCMAVGRNPAHRGGQHRPGQAHPGRHRPRSRRTVPVDRRQPRRRSPGRGACVTDSQLVVTIAALREAGGHPGDRIEHAAMVPDDCIADLADLGVTVVTQPNFVAERGDQYLADVPAAQHDQLWRVASLADGRRPRRAVHRYPVRRRRPVGGDARRRTPGHTRRRRSRCGRDGFAASGRCRCSWVGPTGPRRAASLAPGQPGDLCVLAGTTATGAGRTGRRTRRRDDRRRSDRPH